MGKRNTIRKSAALVDSDDEGSVSSSSTAMSELTLAPETEEVYGGDKVLEQSLEDLFEKRGSTREKALSSLIDGFSNKLQHQFVENKCITLLNQSHSSFKKGSAKEIILASRVIGLLAMTVGCGDSAHEILEESITPFSQAMKSGSDTLKIAAILDCLAVITFVGGSVAEDTERSLQIMWQFVYPKLGQNVIASKPNTATLTAAIIAWTFLLTIKDDCKLTSKPWQETISYFSSLLEKEDRSLRIAAGEALAVIFEVGNLGKIFDESKGSTDEGFTHLQGLKGKIQNQVRALSAEAGGKGLTKKDLSSQRDLFSDILEFLEDGYSPESTMKIGPDVLTVSTWRHLIQLNFLKRFLGGGFVKHMQENVLLHEIFDFTPKKKIFGDVHLSGVDKRMYKSPNSVLNKARTQSLNKKRVMARGRNTGHFALGGDEDV